MWMNHMSKRHTFIRHTFIRHTCKRHTWEWQVEDNWKIASFNFNLVLVLRSVPILLQAFEKSLQPQNDKRYKCKVQQEGVANLHPYQESLVANPWQDIPCVWTSNESLDMNQQPVCHSLQADQEYNCHYWSAAAM